jgi:hypothetical protein
MGAFQRSAFVAAGLQQLRFPGGEPAEWFDLAMTDKCSDGSGANWDAPSYQALWSFAKSASVRSLMLQTNPTPQFCGSGSQDASGAHAAAIVKAANDAGVRLGAVEIGNEPDISDSWFGSHGGADAYTDKFIEHAQAIHAVSADTPVFGPAVCGLGSNCSFPATWDSGWIGNFLAKTGDKASGPGKGTVDGISFHIYIHSDWGFSDLKEAGVDKYGFAQYWSKTAMPYLREQIAKYDSRPLPIAITEISAGNGIPNDAAQTQNMFSVLATLDTLASFAVSGVHSVHWFDANAAGPSDYWLMTASEPRPIFYSFVLWARMGGKMLSVSTGLDPHQVAVYAARDDNGNVQVLGINKTAAPVDLALNITGLDVSGRESVVDLVEPSDAGKDSSLQVKLNGMVGPTPDALPSSKRYAAAAVPTFSLPAYSAAVWRSVAP